MPVYHSILVTVAALYKLAKPTERFATYDKQSLIGVWYVIGSIPAKALVCEINDC